MDVISLAESEPDGQPGVDPHRRTAPYVEITPLKTTSDGICLFLCEIPRPLCGAKRARGSACERTIVVVVLGGVGVGGRSGGAVGWRGCRGGCGGEKGCLGGIDCGGRGSGGGWGGGRMGRMVWIRVSAGWAEAALEAGLAWKDL